MPHTHNGTLRLADHVRQSYGSWIALASFAAIFPGFVVYHVLIASGRIPPILGGYTVAMAALLLPVLVMAYLHEISRTGRLAFVDVAFFSFIAYFGFVVLFQLAVGANVVIAFTELAVIVQFVVLFFVFRLTNVSRTYVVSWLAVIMTTAIVFANVSSGAFVVAVLKLSPAAEQAATHQDYAFAYLIPALFCAVSLESKWSRSLLYLLAVPALFLTGARSEFVGFLFAAMIIETCLARRRAVPMLVAVGLAAAGAIAVNYFLEELSSNRVVDLIQFGFASENSIRQGLLTAAVRVLGDHPLTGNFASYNPGEYAHNVVSVWVDLGALGFIMFAALLLLPFTDLLLQFKSRARDREYLLILVVFAIAILLAVISKHFTYAMFPVALGLFARDSLLRARTALLPAAAVRLIRLEVVHAPDKLGPV